MLNIKQTFILLSLLVLVSSNTYSYTGSSCKANSDCPDLHSCIEDVCAHKNLFPITAREVFGSLLILLMNALLTAGGVGAGAAYVPYIILIFEMTLQKAVTIGYACVFGGGVGNLVSMIIIKNPETNRFFT